MHSELNLSQSERFEKLKDWMRSRTPRLTFVGMAAPLEITSMALSRNCGNTTMPVYQHEHLVEKYGIPARLLPLPADIKPGPKPRPASIEATAV